MPIESAPSTPVSIPNYTPPPLKGLPMDWSIEEVIQFIATNDPVLAIHADLFRKHVSNFEISTKWGCKLIASLLL